MVMSMQITQKVYVVAEKVVNVLVLMVVVAEGVRTRGWKGLEGGIIWTSRILIFGSFNGVRAKMERRGDELISDKHGRVVGQLEIRSEEDSGALCLGSPRESIVVGDRKWPGH